MRNHLHTEYYKYINNLLEPENDSSSKYFWKYINSRKQDSVSIGTLKDNNNIAESAKGKAEMFNSQFCSVFNKEDMENMPDKGQSPHGVMPTIDILIYYTSREFPIQNFHRRTTDILYYYTSREFPIQNFHRRTTDILYYYTSHRNPM